MAHSPVALISSFTPNENCDASKWQSGISYLAMKTILVYTQRLNASYNELFLSLMREGRRRGWCFAIVEPMAAPGEARRIAGLFEVLRPAGFVGGYVGADNVPVVLPEGMPAVWIDTSHAPRGACVVRHDNARFGVAAADALAGGGGGYAVFGLKPHKWSAVRERAFVARLREKRLYCQRVRLDVRDANQFAALCDVRDALKRIQRPVSIFAVTDRLAGVVLMAASSLGWKCPEDLRIIGVDDDEMVCMGAPVTLSSVHPDWAEGGRLVAEALATQMRGVKPLREYLYGAAGVTRRASTRDVYRRPKDERVEKGLAFIAAEFASPIGVADVVAAMGCSRGHAELRFREETGKSILETVEEARWERLLVLLRRGDADLAALPAMCGFRTASALRQFFRRRAGMSMTDWRAANR